jgi:MFS family permease
MIESMLSLFRSFMVCSYLIQATGVRYMSTETNATNSAASIASTGKITPLWRNRDYLLLIGGQAVSSIGSEISLVAFPLLIFALTRSPAQTGLMTSLRSLPYALFTLPAGALVDRWDRKRLMIFCDTGRAIALGSIPIALLLGHLTYVQLYLVSLIEGTLFVFFTLAQSASFPRVVAPEQLPVATGQNETLYSLSTMIGPSLAPILYSLGRAIPFLADAVSYLCSVISLLFINTRFQEKRDEDVMKVAHLWADIKEGISWLWHNPLMRFIAILTFGLNTPCCGYVLIIILLAQHVHASNATLGLIFAGGGLGSVIGAVLAGPLYRRFGFARMVIGSAWLWALLWLLYAFAPNPLVLSIVNVVSFTVVPIYGVVQYSYRLATIPDHLQGRVNSVFRLIALSSQPLGIAVTGLLLQVVGPVDTILWLFVPQFALCIAATVNKYVRGTFV